MIKIIKEGNRILMDGNTLPVLTDINIKIEYVIAEMIGYVFVTELTSGISRKDLQDIFDKVLILWDKDTTIVDMNKCHFEFVERYDKMFKFNDKEDHLGKIKVWSVNKFYKVFETNRELYNEFMSYSIICIGPLNRINPVIFNYIMDMYPTALRLLFGDEKLDSPENNNYHNRYLTNSNTIMSIPYFMGRDSDEKKVNSVIDKLRKTNVKLVDLSAAVVKVFDTEMIDIDNVSNYIEDNNTLVIIPSRFIDSVNSRLFDYKYGDSKLDLQIGMELVLTHPFIVKAENNSEGLSFIINPFTKVWISKVVRKFSSRGNYLYDIDIQVRHNDKLVLIKNVLLDWTYYLLQFNKDYHPENESDFNNVEYRSVVDTNIWKPDILKCIPFMVTTISYAKYCIIDRIVGYVETIDSWMLEKHIGDLYSYISPITKEAIIHKAYNFDEI